MKTISYRLTLLTPLFSRGSYDASLPDSAEIRAPSIRGQLHHWLRILGYGAAVEREIFGSVHRDFGGRGLDPAASRVVVRVSRILGHKGTPATLPHKFGGQASPKAAYLPGTSFELHVLERLGGLSEKTREAFHRALETWLCAGTLGLRATRASGSFRWERLSATGPIPAMSWSNCEETLRRLLDMAPCRWALLGKTFTQPEEARKVVSDTIGGRDDRDGQSELARLRDPLGKVFGGRKTSPLRFRILACEGTHRILALWDDRTAVTHNQPRDLAAVIGLLANGTQSSRPKEIGRLLAGTALARA
jgi:hypothetical protein